MKDLQSCTFKPKINKYQLPKSGHSVQDRLILWKEKQMKRIEKLKEEKTKEELSHS